VIGFAGAALGAVAVAAVPMVAFRENRIVDGVTATALSALGPLAWIALALWIVTGGIAVLRPSAIRSLLRACTASSAFLLVLAASGAAATRFADSSQSVAARTSFGLGFYLTVLALFLSLYASPTPGRGRLVRLVAIMLPLVGVAALAAAGALDQLGIVREFDLARATFVREVRRHLFYALGATGLAVALGVPMGVLSAHRPRLEALVMGGLNLGQVFPALAFVGLMMPVLGDLGDRFTALKSVGVSGIGWAPVFVVLLVYALYPVTRNTLVAIRQLDAAVIDSARGMGMSRWRLLAEVELPLAFPVVLAGVRVALVQSTAGAIVAAFVGGGGLGTIVFFGLEQTSMDLVLVGVLPIVALALGFDAALRGLEGLLGGEVAIAP
jgi:osmoprotectant transport system permease protein